MRNRATNHKPARKSRAMVLSLALGVSLLALWVFGSNLILKVARMIDAPVTKQVAMEVVIPVAMPASSYETPISKIARTDWPDEPAAPEPAAAEPAGTNLVAWEPVAPNRAEANSVIDQSASDRSIPSPAPAPVAPDQAASEQTTPTPSKPIVARVQATPSPAASVETAPVVSEPAAASEPLVPKPVRTVAAEARTTPSPTASVVVASVAAPGAGVEPPWPGRLVARAVEGVADETSEQSSVPVPRTRPHVVFVPLPAPRPGIGKQQRSVAHRVLTEADVRIQELHF